MKITVHEIEEIEIYDLDIMTLQVFLDHFYRDDTYGWNNGWLMRFTFFEDDINDRVMLDERKRIFKAIDVCPMPKFEDTVTTRFGNKTVINYSGNKISQAIMDHILSNYPIEADRVTCT